MSKELKTYKITNKRTGETFSVKFPAKPTQDQIKNISSLREKNQEQGEVSNLQADHPGFFPSLANVLYAPSEAIAPKVMAPEDVEQLPTSERLMRLGQETASGLLDPSNIAVAAPAFTGPLGLAASSIVGGSQMLMNAPAAVKAAMEHPSLETIGRTGILGAGIAGAGYGLKTGMKGYGTPEVKVPTVNAPKQIATENKKLLTEAPPIDTEFIDPITNRARLLQDPNPSGSVITPEIKNSRQIIGNDAFTESGDVVSPPSTLPEQQLLDIPGKQKQLTESTRIPGEPLVTPPPGVNAPGQGQIEGIVGQKQIEGWYGNFSKKKTSTLLNQRERALGKERTVIDEILKRRGALPDESEVLPIETKPIENTIPAEINGNIEPSNDNIIKYNQAIENLVKHKRDSIDSKTFQDIRELGKQAGLDKGRIDSDIVDNTNKRWDILDKNIKVKSPIKEQPKEIENKWLKEQDTQVLQSMRDGSSGQLRSEIDSVLGERNLTKEGKVNQETKLPERVKSNLEDKKVKTIEDSATPRGGEIDTTKENLNEEKFNQYNEHLDDLVSMDTVESQHLRDIVQLGKDAGLDQDTIIADMIDNSPRISNNARKIQNATDKVFGSEGEKGFGSIDFFLGKLSKKAKGTESEGPISEAAKQLSFFARSLPKPESVIGRMGEAGLKLKRKIENAQYESDRLKGQVEVLTHDAFKDLTPRQIGQRIAVLKGGKEIPLTKENMDKYVDWENGAFKSKKGVSKIIRMKGSLSNVILDNATPATPEIAQAAEIFRKSMEILGNEGEKSGVSMISSGGKYIPFEKAGMDYWPREYTNGFFESLKKNPKDWDRIVKDVSDSKGVTLKEAEEMLQNKKLYAEVTTRAQHQRTFKQDSFAIDPSVVFDHVNKFSGRVGMAKSLGPEDIRGSIVGDDLKQLMNEGFDWKFASDTISRLVNREGVKDLPGKTESTLYKAVTNLNNARLMTSFIINNLANITTTAARVGELNTLKGFGAMMGNLEVSRRMATLSGATEHTGIIEGSSSKISKILGVPQSERFMRTWADQSGRITANGLVDYLGEVKIGSPEFLRGKKLLDNLLGKDSGETIQRGFLTNEEQMRAGWQLAKDSQGIINPGTMPPLAESIQNPMLRLGVNLAMQYKRMALLGMNSLSESFKLNPTRTIKTLAVTAPIIGELIGDAGSALFGGLAGTLTGEGTAKVAIRDINDRGKSLAKAAAPLLKKKLGLTDSQANIVGRYIDDMNRGFALGLIGDLLYSVAYRGGEAGADVVSGGISPAFEFIYDIAKDIMNNGKDMTYATTTKKAGNIAKNVVSDVLPQRPVSAYKRSESKSKGKGGIVVHPPSLPKF